MATTTPALMSHPRYVDRHVVEAVAVRAATVAPEERGEIQLFPCLIQRRLSRLRGNTLHAPCFLEG
eukprot:gene27076-51370_t